MGTLHSPRIHGWDLELLLRVLVQNSLYTVPGLHQGWVLGGFEFSVNATWAGNGARGLELNQSVEPEVEEKEGGEGSSEGVGEEAGSEGAKRP